MSSLHTLAVGLARALPGPLRRPLARHYFLWAARRPEADLDVVRVLVDEGDTVVDVGAAIGTYAVPLAGWVGPRGRVVAIEPIPGTADILSENAAALGFAHVKILRHAVADYAGDGFMIIPGRNKYLARLGDGTIRVPVSTLDALITPTASFIKIDVEGYELPVLRGAATLLTSRPALLVEITRDGDVIRRLLEARGYGAYRYHRGRLRPWTGGGINTFFLTGPHLARLEERAPSLFRDD